MLHLTGPCDLVTYRSEIYTDTHTHQILGRKNVTWEKLLGEQISPREQACLFFNDFCKFLP